MTSKSSAELEQDHLDEASHQGRGQGPYYRAQLNASVKKEMGNGRTNSGGGGELHVLSNAAEALLSMSGTRGISEDEAAEGGLVRGSKPKRKPKKANLKVVHGGYVYDESNKAKNKPKKVKAVTSQGHVLAVYQSAHEAARRTSISQSTISQICSGKRQHSNGFIFRLADPHAELNQLSLEELLAAKQVTVERGEHIPIEVKSTKPKKVEVITSQGHVLAAYESASEAARRTGISDSHIGKVSSGKRPHTKGFIFRFAEPDAPLNQLSLEELYEAKRGAIQRGEDVASLPTAAGKKRRRTTKKDASLERADGEAEGPVRVKMERREAGPPPPPPPALRLGVLCSKILKSSSLDDDEEAPAPEYVAANDQEEDGEGSSNDSKQQHFGESNRKRPRVKLEEGQLEGTAEA